MTISTQPADSKHWQGRGPHFKLDTIKVRPLPVPPIMGQGRAMDQGCLDFLGPLPFLPFNLKFPPSSPLPARIRMTLRSYFTQVLGGLLEILSRIDIAARASGPGI
jgi:hypothetical protein